MGEAKRKALARQNQPIALDTFGGRIHVEWDSAAAVTPLGQLPFFIDFLKVSGLFDAWVVDCPLVYRSNNASDKREVLATFLLSILAGHHRYAHITAIRQDGIHPELLGVEKLVSEDAARRALTMMDEAAGVALAGAASGEDHATVTGHALDTRSRRHRQMPIRQTGRRAGRLQPEETGTPLALLSQCPDGQYPIGVGGGSHGRQRDCADPQHARDMGLAR